MLHIPLSLMNRLSESKAIANVIYEQEIPPSHSADQPNSAPFKCVYNHVISEEFIFPII